MARIDAQPDLDCARLVELVTDYLEGAPLQADLVRLEGHLAACQGCRHYLEQMRETIRATGRLGPEEIPPDALDGLLDVYRAYRRD
jgi:predicted anti-sigma-YlaC factor YlaD